MSKPRFNAELARNHPTWRSTDISDLIHSLACKEAELKQQGADLAAALLNPRYKAGWEDGYKTAREYAHEAAQAAGGE